jgi:hypothetical protein
MKKTVTQAKNSKVIQQDFGVGDDRDSLIAKRHRNYKTPHWLPVVIDLV